MRSAPQVRGPRGGWQTGALPQHRRTTPGLAAPLLTSRKSRESPMHAFDGVLLVEFLRHCITLIDLHGAPTTVNDQSCGGLPGWVG